MSRPFIASLLCLVALTLPLLEVPGRVVAGPPEKASGKMVLDEVADGLRKFRLEKDQEKRILLLEMLAPSCDPRVAVALGEEMDHELAQGETDRYWDAAILLAQFFVKRPLGFNPRASLPWWEKNQADLHRRAKQLPQ